MGTYNAANEYHLFSVRGELWIAITKQQALPCCVELFYNSWFRMKVGDSI